ncbi:ribonuclease pancreatic-like [Sorex fumeus]|uniref:ribonuclease pancreatic-like n=1 Tax=Sorex fumeus TaxID=62283 RepID=UPI0024ACDC90|nr:ribonuclease pancreatic-like [Sorex fumeus]
MEVTPTLKKSLVLFPLLVVVLLGPGWVHSSLSQESQADRFYRQHIDPDNPFGNKTSYCDVMMWRRNINWYSCKKLNTFVHTSRATARAVCREKLTACRNGTVNCHKSRSSMRITQCNLKGGSKYPNCAYWSTQRTAHILVVCDGNSSKPIHFDSSV